MSRKHTSSTPANVSRSKSAFTRRQRAQIRQNMLEVRAQIDAYEAMYGDWDDESARNEDRETCDRCGGDGSIEYAEAGPSEWGEDCPSEVNHLIECPDCGGTGKAT